MYSDVAHKWVKALRSGKYTQRRGIMFDGECHCALGVLVDLYLKKHKKDWNKGTEKILTYLGDGDEMGYVEARSFRGETTVLPLEVVKWAGMTESDGTFLEEYAPGKWTRADRQAVTEMNDTGKDFDTIADAIEQDHGVL